MEDFFNQLVGQYGIYAVFLLCMIEGDITLLLAGVMAHNRAFGQYSFGQVVLFGTAGAVFGDFIGYLIGRVFDKQVSKYRFYQMAQPRIERLTHKFGSASIFISKYIYGIRAAWCMFLGIAKIPWWKFLLLDTINCFFWVLILSGVGYFFSGAVTGLIGDFHRFSIVLLIIFIVGITGFYLLERFWLSKKVELVDEEKIHNLEKAAHTTLHDLQERLHLRSNNSSNQHHNEPPPPTPIPKTKVESDLPKS